VQQHGIELGAAELAFDESNPLSNDIWIHLKKRGVSLRFEPVSQRLVTVEMYQLHRANLKYSGHTICTQGNNSSDAVSPATLRSVHAAFGPTYPGKYDAKHQVYVLSYPGICLFFAVPASHPHISQVSNPPASGVPLQFSDGTSLELSRLTVFFGELPTRALPQLSADDYYFEQLRVHITKGVTFTKRNVFIGFDQNCSPQDILSALGAPSDTFVKQVDKLSLHASTGNDSRPHGSSAPTAHGPVRRMLVVVYCCCC
jgi:phagosome assembly factor 1